MPVKLSSLGCQRTVKHGFQNRRYYAPVDNFGLYRAWGGNGARVLTDVLKLTRIRTCLGLLTCAPSLNDLVPFV